MTAISALISKDWIAAASDSLLTEFHPSIVPIKDQNGKTAYDFAKEAGDKKIIDYLEGFK